MRSNNACVARSEVFIHQAMINYLFAGCEAHIDFAKPGIPKRWIEIQQPPFSSD
jgi:hypothetical protein